MQIYADSSFLVSCYIADANTSRANAFLQGLNSPLLLTALQLFEVRNAFELCVFRGLVSKANITLALNNLENDLKAGRLVRTQLNWPLAFRLGMHLGRRYSSRFGTRSIDVLHVAAAKTLRAGEFVSFDDRQRDLALAVGFAVRP